MARPPRWLDLMARPGVSQWMHRAVTARPPRVVVQAAIRAFARAYKIDLDEIAEPIASFVTFQDFFTRSLRAGARPIEADPGRLPSPSDGTFSAFGALGEGVLVQAKGVEYRLDDLLGGNEDADAYRGGSYAVVYLAPHNYHRVHMPVDGTIVEWRYLPGALYPVNQIGLRHVDGLFARNERIIAHVESEVGRAAVILVGATFVGHMRTVFTDLAANEGHADTGLQRLDPMLALRRGDEVGVFEMGSTVVLIFERGDLQPEAALGQPIRMGEALLRLP